MSDFIKAEKVVKLSLGLLTRETVMARLVWRNAAGDFRGAKGDTITVRLPSYAVANSRGLRSGDSRTKSELHERAVAVTLTENIYHDMGISDEELTLDIESFGEQVASPVMGGMARALEDHILTTVTGATYANTLTLNESDPYQTLLQARSTLNLMRVPMEGRAVAIGSDVEMALLASDRLSNVNTSGSDDALRDATVGRVAGFTLVSVPGLPPGEAYAFHRSAYVLSQRAPIVPAGAPWGALSTHDSFAIRAVRVFDPNEVEDRYVTDAFVGSNVVTDNGSVDAEDGTFTPSSDPADGSDLFVRSVKITSGGS